MAYFNKDKIPLKNTFRTKTAKRVEKVDTFDLAIGNHQTLTVVVAFMKFVMYLSSLVQASVTKCCTRES